MKNILVLFLAIFLLFSCSKDDDSIGNKLQLSMESCVLDNEHSHAEVGVLNMKGTLQVTSSNPDIAEIRFDGQASNEDMFYIIGHGIGKATITVIDMDYTKTGEYNMNTIDVEVREPIYYPDFSTGFVFIKPGESRVFSQRLDFDESYSLVVENNNVAEVFASPEMGKKIKVDAKRMGDTRFHILKGKTELTTYHIYVVDEYDLFIPPSEDRQLTFKLPFTVGVNGISIWRGSGQYSAKVVDETIARVKSITPSEDWVTEMNNSAAVRVEPLKVGETRLIVTDMVTGQTAGVDIKVD